ncbi:LRR receptor-like serine/threonine-protein kinase GSO2 [Herrania umbratica]|uniref:LRR receptor-like serine/threonine-protein kinase GSO2 n=1 Tax=Herrania umbratica TaxID=108875 RepID=A0A6J1APK0_9ROSI|nr:LRR receptor-like serine/threonine-protein kinase GSO2 [Herrania umbratica]
MRSFLGSYQFVSFLFLYLYSQAYISSCFTSSMQRPTWSHNEGQALLLFKQTLFIDYTASLLCNSNYGSPTNSFPKTDSWKEDSDFCLWDGVTCDGVTDHVIGLDLSCSWLYGTIPSNSTLFLLQHLKRLNLAFNNFGESKISAKFGQFPNLTHLNLSSSFFSGQVPSEISYLSKLVSLDLSTFSLPPVGEQEPFQELMLETTTLKRLAQNFSEVEELFLAGIDMCSVDAVHLVNLSSSLTSLSLDDCGLNGTISDRIFQFPNLKLLKLGNNPELVVYLPKSNGSSALEVLDLKQTILVGELSDSIRGLKSLKSLNVASCDLNGSIPASLVNLSQIVVLELSDNKFSGWIPASLANLTQLQHLDASYNELEGTIPHYANGFSKLVTLFLPSNLLNGTIPPWVFKLPSLQLLSLANNRLTGHISEFRSKSLSIIYLKNNMLQGHIPSSIFQLVNLTVLDLSLNNFSGIVELDMFSQLQNLESLDLSLNSLSLSSENHVDYTLTKLQSLSLSSCNLSEFPNFLRGSKVLKFLDLSKNRIQGQIPKWMWKVGKESLLHLYLDHNFLTGHLQFPWRNVVILYLQSNLFQGVLPIPPVRTSFFSIANNYMTGEIPSLICMVSSLKIVDVSHNNLSGKIPSCLLNFSQNLLVLDLRANNFHGAIPKSIVEPCSLENLNFHGNQIEGLLPGSLANCRNLQVLDLGKNKFTGTFPNWLETLPMLQVLVLSSNKFHGVVNNSRARLLFPKLRVLDLSNNDFVGPFPACYIENLKAMANLTDSRSSSKYVEGSRSYDYSVVLTIKGQEVELVKVLTIFTSMDLSNNYFQGVIPEVIGKLNSLIGLNLSHNNFFGHIPPSIGNLINLEWLDLSSNKFIGNIPQELVNLTFLVILNLSKNQLVGSIPQGKQFNTFENSSYEGNVGLCGFPLSKACNEIGMQKPTIAMKESGIGFGWKVVLMGYGCGLIFGLTGGYLIFQTGKPKWIINLVEGKQLQRGKRSRK